MKRLALALLLAACGPDLPAPTEPACVGVACAIGSECVAGACLKSLDAGTPFD